MEKIGTKCRDLIVKSGLSEVLNQRTVTSSFVSFHKENFNHIIFYIKVFLSNVFYFFSLAPVIDIYKFISRLSSSIGLLTYFCVCFVFVLLEASVSTAAGIQNFAFRIDVIFNKTGNILFRQICLWYTAYFFFSHS